MTAMDGGNADFAGAKICLRRDANPIVGMGRSYMNSHRSRSASIGGTRLARQLEIPCVVCAGKAAFTAED